MQIDNIFWQGFFPGSWHGKCEEHNHSNDLVLKGKRTFYRQFNNITSHYLDVLNSPGLEIGLCEKTQGEKPKLKGKSK